MITVEVAIEKMAEALSDGLFKNTLRDPWAFSFIRNVSEYIARDKPLSTEQARISLKLLERSRKFLTAKKYISDDSISSLLSAPRYRHQPYESVHVPREARYVGGGKIALRFKRDDTVTNLIRNMESPDALFDSPLQNTSLRIVVVPVCRQTLATLYSVITEHRFAIDEDTFNYLLSCFAALDNNTCTAFVDGDAITISTRDNDILTWWTRNVIMAEPNDL